MNPFFLPKAPERTLFTYLEKVFVGVFLFPIRFVTIFLSVSFCALLFKVSTLGLDHKQRDQPFARWREIVLLPISFMYRFILFTAGFHSIKRIGHRETDGSKAPVFVSNHVSFWDGFVGCLDTWKLPSFVSKKEAIDAPVTCALLKATRSILIDRTDPDSRKKAREDIIVASQKAHREGGPQVFIFPEGTTTNGQSLISFKPGAFFSGLPVQPICLKYGDQRLSWTHDNASFFRQIISPLFYFSNSMEITYLPVYKPNEEERKDPALYATNVRQVMAKSLGVRMTEHSFEDVRLLVECQKQRENPHAMDNIVFNEFQTLFNMNYGEMQEMIRNFAEYDKNKTGHLNKKDFGALLKMPDDSPAFDDIFNMLDTEHHGEIDLAEFFRGLAKIKKENANDEEIIRHTFNVFDPDSKGYIVEGDYMTVMKQRYPSITDETCRELFVSADSSGTGKLNYEEFKLFAQTHPVYMELAKNLRKRRLEKEAEDARLLEQQGTNTATAQ